MVKKWLKIIKKIKLGWMKGAIWQSERDKGDTMLGNGPVNPDSRIIRIGFQKLGFRYTVVTKLGTPSWNQKN